MIDDRNRNFTEALVVTISMVMFFSFGYILIDLPGLYYDEMLFVNAALGNLNNSFIHKTILDIPVMLMPYIGALKAWIYSPILYFFDINSMSIRLPVVIIGVITLFLNYIVVKKLFNSFVGIVFIIFAGFDQTVIIHTVFDWGPVTLMMLIRALLILSLLKFIDTRNKKYLFLTFFFASLGIFDKAHFVWIVSALTFSLFFININLFRSNYKMLLAGLLFFIAVIGFLSLQIDLSKEFVTENFASRFQYLIVLLKMTITGESAITFVSNTRLPQSDNYLFFLGVIFYFSSIGIFILLFKNIYRKNILILTLFTVFILIQLFITKKATGSHHVIMLAPIYSIYFSLGIYGWYKLFSQSNLASVMPIIVITLFTIMSIQNNRNIITVLSSHLSPKWEKASFDLASSIQMSNPKNIVCIDWGIGTILVGLVRPIHVNDYWAIFMNPMSTQTRQWFENEYITMDTIFIVPAEGKASFIQTRQNFLEMNKNNNWNLQIVEIIYSFDKKPWYEIYKK